MSKLALVAWLTLLAAPGYAQEEEADATDVEMSESDAWGDPSSGEEPVSTEPVGTADDLREAPDYSGRGEPPQDPTDPWLWIPRILFGPLYLVSEYVIRQPVGFLVTEVERSSFLGEFFDFFTFGEERDAGLVPTVFFDFGFLPSVGLYLWWNDVGTEGNQVRVAAGFWGTDWLHATISDRIQLDDQNELSFEIEGLRRPDYLWHGGGWDADINRRSRYGRSNLGGGLRFINRPWRASEIRYRADLQYNEFDNSSFSDIPIEQAAAQGFYNIPSGFTNGYFAFMHRLDLTLDTREERPAPGNGIRVQGWFGQGVDLQRADDMHWLRFGGQLGLFLDVGEQRVIQLVGYLDMTESLTDEATPFTEQVAVGNQPTILGGFLPGTLVGPSAVALSLEYHYPIWVFVEGTIHVSVGNVFAERFRDFDAERLRMSFGFGFRTIGDRDNSALIMLAFGTEPFVHGTEITSVRFVVGSQSGF